MVIKTKKGSLGAAVKLLLCYHEVTGLSPGNSLLLKCMERLHTGDLKWSDPSLNPVQAGATCTGLPFCAILNFSVSIKKFFVKSVIWLPFFSNWPMCLDSVMYKKCT